MGSLRTTYIGHILEPVEIKVNLLNALSLSLFDHGDIVYGGLEYHEWKGGLLKPKRVQNAVIRFSLI